MRPGGSHRQRVGSRSDDVQRYAHCERYAHDVVDHPTTTIKIWPKFAASIATPTTTATTPSSTTTTSSTTQATGDTTTSTSYITRDPVDKTPGIYVPDFSKSVLKQGDMIKSWSRNDGTSDWYKTCTTGYIDRVNHNAVVARHCVGPADANGVTKFYDDNENLVGETTGKDAGVYSPSPSDDWVNVKLYNDSAPTPNPYTTNKIVDSKQLRDGDIVCMEGDTTGHHCGHVDADLSEGNTIAVPDMTVQQGDSGSPVWVNDANGNPIGITGIVTKSTTWTLDDGSKVTGTSVTGITPATS